MAVTDFTVMRTYSSAEGRAVCTEGTISVRVQAVNSKLDLEDPPNQTMLTDTILNIIQPRSSFTKDVVTGSADVCGSYNIHAKLCIPRNANVASLDTIQFLTHGGSLNSFYWDIAPRNSYVEAAAEAGYATFVYDRLGSGNSDRPDPIQVVQGSIQIEIMHKLVQALRNGVIGGHPFKKVVGMGHSLGSALTIGQTHGYPKDFDSLVLTGFSLSTSSIPATLAAPAYVPADTDPRFANLSKGYILQVGAQAIHFLFFKYPHYDQNIFEEFVVRKDTATLGEFLTVGRLVLPTPEYTGSVNVVNGEADFPFCGGNCYYPSDLTAAVTPTLFPSAASGSQHYNVPNVGHNIFAHHEPQRAFQQIFGFLRAN